MATPLLAHILDAGRKLAATAARIDRRLGTHLQHTAAALHALNLPELAPASQVPALPAKGNFQRQTVTTRKNPCNSTGSRDTAR